MKVRVGSITLVIPGKDETIEDDANQISIVQRSPMIINRVRTRRSAGPKSTTEEWI